MQIGKYTLGRLIGQGGAGSVYESLHPQLARPVAVKLMHTNDATARAEFLQEAQTVAALSHPNIINIFDVDEYQGQPFLVMELIERSLADRLAKGPLALTPAIEMLLPLLDGLSYAHRQGVIHCDLKPGNVLLRGDGTPVLADFGLALKGSAQPGTPVGTPEYMAPEQIRNEPLDARTDIYSLGALIYEALTGQPPFSGDVPAVIRGHLTQEPAAPSVHIPTLSARVDAFILQLLAKKPADRPQSVMEVATALRLLGGQRAVTQSRAAPPTVPLAANPVPPKAASPFARQSKPTRLPPLLAVGAMIMLLAAIGLARAILQPVSQDSLVVTNPTVAVVTARPTRELAPLQLSQRSTAPMVDAKPASNTLDFSVSGVTWEDDPNSILFVGELRNESGAARERIQVQIELLNEAGGVMASSNGFIERSYLNAGEISPFHVYFTGAALPSVAFTTYRILVQSVSLGDFTRGYTIVDGLQFTVDQVGQGSFGNAPVIRGTFLNNRDTAVGFPKIIIVFYNEADQVIGVTDTYAATSGPGNLLPAKSISPFETNIVILTERNPTSYMLYVEANRSS